MRLTGHSQFHHIWSSLAIALIVVSPATGQFVDEFEGPLLDGWTYFAGDGSATIEFRPADGYATAIVDASLDRYNIWWALIKHEVSDWLDLARLEEPGIELRMEARIRSSHAPRRVNLHLNTQRTVDFHTHLMEYDIPDTVHWHTISMTTRGFDARPGDIVNAQMALMDWGSAIYRVDVDYLRVDIVEAAVAGEDRGEPLPYHPRPPDPNGFSHVVGVAHDSMVDARYPTVNFDGWIAADSGARTRALSAEGDRWIILRWDLSTWVKRRVARLGLLDLTTHSVQRAPSDVEELGSVRVVEILGGDPAWDEETVTFASLLGGGRIDDVFNSQMIIDMDPLPEDGSRLYVPISRPVLQRMIDGTTLGLMIRPLGPVSAAFVASEEAGGAMAPMLRFDLTPP